MSRDELISRGFEKKVLELDTREAQRLGLMRPLVRKEIEKHFEDFGLEAEFTSHNTMRGLSGGQKVKVVLGAATWRRPHIIMLDEPTNYLDRESLAALIEALKDFEGGVLVITHNREFSESICSEVWAMRDGRLEASGHNWVEGQGTGARIDKKADGEEEDQFDSMGNKIAKVQKVAKKSAAELRKAKKDRIARRKRGEEVRPYRRFQFRLRSRIRSLTITPFSGLHRRGAINYRSAVAPVEFPTFLLCFYCDSRYTTPGCRYPHGIFASQTSPDRAFSQRAGSDD